MPTDLSNKKFEPGQEPMLEPTDEPLKKKIIRKSKPIVEGINSPVLQVVEPVPVSVPEVVPSGTSPNLQSTSFQTSKVQLTEAEKILMNTDTPKVILKEAVKVPTKEVFLKPQITIRKEDPRLLSKKAVERATTTGGHIVRNILFIVIALLLILGGYELYAWYKNKPTGLEEVSQPNIIPTPTDVVSTPEPTVIITPTPTITPSGKQLKISATPTGYLNVRSLPSTTGKQVGQVHPGDILPYTTTKSGWYQVTLPEGVTGWVIGQYVTVMK